MTTSLTDELFIVIRSAQERSLPLCLEAVRAQTNHFVLIEEYPFLNAVKKTFAIGAKRKEPFLLALDADVVLYPHALETILQEAKAAFEASLNMVCFDCHVLDKFRGKTLAGCHIYVQRYIKDIISHFDSIEYDISAPKPERSNLINFTKKHNLILIKNSTQVGLHDYEQYYNHLFIKYYRRAIRWPEEINRTLKTIETRHLFHPNDQDFNIVLAGLKAGIGQKEVPFDARLYPPISDLMGIEEKPPLV